MVAEPAQDSVAPMNGSRLMLDPEVLDVPVESALTITLLERNAAYFHTLSVVYPQDTLLAGPAYLFPGPSFEVGPYPAGTVEIRLDAYDPNPPHPFSNTAIARVTGSFPTWTVEFEDGGDNDFDDIIISVQASPVNPTWSVDCTPKPVTRGATVRCEGTLAPAVAYSVVQKTSHGTNFTIADTVVTNHTANQVHVWEGVAVANASVTMDIRIDGQSDTTFLSSSDSVIVANRAWAPPALSSPVEEIIALAPGVQMLAVPVGGRPLVLGGAVPKYPLPYFSTGALTRAADGPNRGLVMFASNDAASWGFRAYIHPGLFGLAPSAAWYNDQDGQGSGSCTNSVFSVLVPEIRRHEGVTSDPRSHWNIAVGVYANMESPTAMIERISSLAPDTTLRRVVYDSVINFHRRAPYRTSQAAFDAADYPLVNAAIGCTLDYLPKPGDA